MLNITLGQLKSDIAAKMKGTSIIEIGDFYGTVAGAANRMLARVDTEETRCTVTMTVPFFDNINTYPLVTDYKRMIDIRPQANRYKMPGRSNFSQTSARQFNERLDANSFSIFWNKMIRSIRAQRLPAGNTTMLESFDGTISGTSFVGNGIWNPSGDISGLYIEVLNFVQGNSSLGMNISGVTGTGYIENTTAAVTDLSALQNENSSFIWFWIPIGFSLNALGQANFTSFKLRRGDSITNYIEATAVTKADGTAFTDGWNQIRFDWVSATKTGTPTNLNNTYRRLTVNTRTGTAFNNCLIDNWTDALGSLYEIEYYSEYLFRDGTTGAWKQKPTQDTDLVNVGTASYEILKTEMMVDITQQIRSGEVMTSELADWRLMLNGTSASRYVKDPPYHGLYQDYVKSFPSSAIVTQTILYQFDV